MLINSIGNIKQINQIKSPLEVKNIGTPASEKNDFLDSIKNGLDSVQKLQDEANNEIKQCVSSSSKDPSEAVISMLKAEISMQLTLQVRNKLIDAYQEITKMSI